MKFDMQAGPGPGHIVLDGDPAPLPHRGQSPPQCSAHICCGQMAAWIKMVLGMEVGLSPGDFVLDGDPALPKKAVEPPPQFSAHFYCGETAWMHQDATWNGGRPQPRGLCVPRGPSPPPQKGDGTLSFWPMSIAAKRLHGSRCHLVWREASAQATLC